MENLDFSIIETGEDLIQIDEATGMPIVGGGIAIDQKTKDVKKDIDKTESEEKVDLIEIPDKTIEKTETPGLTEVSNPSSDSVFKVLIEALGEKGVLTSQINMEEVDKAIAEGEEPSNIIFELMNHELETQVEFYKQQLPEKIRTLIDRYEEGVPFEELLKIKTEQQKLDNVQESTIKENVDIQKAIIKHYLTEKGETETRINKHIKRLEELEELEEDALEANVQLKEIYKQKEDSLKEKTVEAERKKETDRIAMLETIKTNINNTQEIIPNLPLREKDKVALMESMTRPIGVDEYGNPISTVLKTRSINPVEFEKVLHYYHLIGLFNFDKKGQFAPDFSKLTADIRTKTVDKLSKILTSEDKPGGGSAAKVVLSVKAEENVDKVSRFLKQN